ncbi:multicopper oxidase family protein [Streptomyces sp. NRRL S-241]|uniref:multicopper oxidase family protein n=1 Tax=Streptomyces sp. NRRL S-241 TaxID=1463896 RepID=UPI0004C0B9A2|nr:multicopper oxidase family protein [Streptomyces sp. NRRL S-241]
MRSLPTRRAVLAASAAAALGSGLLTACSGPSGGTGHSGGTGSGTGHGSMNHGGSAADVPEGYVDPAGPEVRAAEAARKATGPVTEVKVTATATPLDLGAGITVRSWAYGDRLPGQEVRATAGGTLALTLANNLPEATSLHWHGLALRNDMDGVPGLTQRDIAPGGSFPYRFAVPHPGTYWFHPHTGVQQDRGLYAPLIVEDPKEPLSYDKEWVVVLDDWIDGVDGATPDAVLAELRKGMDGNAGAHAGHGQTPSAAAPSAAASASPSTGKKRSYVAMGGHSDYLGGDAGDVAYAHYLINGRVPDDPSVLTARPGDRIRLRLINAGGDTAFRIALGGHELTVTHTDGYPVEQATTASLLLGMGERYDVLVTAQDGVFPLTALAEGKEGSALAVLRTGSGAAPTAATRPSELDAPPLMADALRAAGSAALAPRDPDRTVQIKLSGSMQRYNWSFDGKPYTPDQRHPVKAGERVRLVFANATPMWHPLHLHGHTFALGDQPGGARKDTAIVLPGRRLTVDFDADNPGLWMTHCHNVYHSESGMMTVLGYQL